MGCGGVLCDVVRSYAPEPKSTINITSLAARVFSKYYAVTNYRATTAASPPAVDKAHDGATDVETARRHRSAAYGHMTLPAFAEALH